MRRTVPLITAAMLLSWLYVHERFVRDDFDRAFTRSLHMVSTRYKTMSIPHGWAYRHAQTKGKVILVSVLIILFCITSFLKTHQFLHPISCLGLNFHSWFYCLLPICKDEEHKILFDAPNLFQILLTLYFDFLSLFFSFQNHKVLL